MNLTLDVCEIGQSEIAGSDLPPEVGLGADQLDAASDGGEKVCSRTRSENETLIGTDYSCLSLPGLERVYKSTVCAWVWRNRASRNGRSHFLLGLHFVSGSCLVTRRLDLGEHQPLSYKENVGWAWLLKPQGPEFSPFL